MLYRPTVRHYQTLVNLPADGCRWPVSETADGSYLFCNAAAVDGARQPYCAEHAAKARSAYQPPGILGRELARQRDANRAAKPVRRKSARVAREPGAENSPSMDRRVIIPGELITEIGEALASGNVVHPAGEEGF